MYRGRLVMYCGRLVGYVLQHNDWLCIVASIGYVLWYINWLCIVVHQLVMYCDSECNERVYSGASIGYVLWYIGWLCIVADWLVMYCGTLISYISWQRVYIAVHRLVTYCGFTISIDNQLIINWYGNPTGNSINDSIGTHQLTSGPNHQQIFYHNARDRIRQL